MVLSKMYETKQVESQQTWKKEEESVNFLEKKKTANGINHFLEDLLSQDLCTVTLQKVYFGFLSD